jgi:hypothetical protein
MEREQGRAGAEAAATGYLAVWLGRFDVPDAQSPQVYPRPGGPALVVSSTPAVHRPQVRVYLP